MSRTVFGSEPRGPGQALHRLLDLVRSQQDLSQCTVRQCGIRSQIDRLAERRARLVMQTAPQQCETQTKMSRRVVGTQRDRFVEQGHDLVRVGAVDFPNDGEQIGPAKLTGLEPDRFPATPLRLVQQAVNLVGGGQAPPGPARTGMVEHLLPRLVQQLDHVRLHPGNVGIGGPRRGAAGG